MTGSGLELEKFHYTPNGNGDRFVALNVGEVLLSSVGRSRVFYTVRSDGRWRVNEGSTAGDVERRARDVVDQMRTRALVLAELGEAGDDDALRGSAESLRKWAHASDTPQSLRGMSETGCLMHGLVCDAERDFDNALNVLATPAGLLELSAEHGAKVRPVSPQDMITMSTSVSYKPALLYGEDPASPGPPPTPPALVQQYFDTFLPDETRRRLVFKALGSALLGGNPGRLLMILKGSSGTNGKTQLVEALRKVMGTYAGVGNPSMFRGNLDDKPRPDVISVLKKRMVFLAEASKSWELHGDRVKAITGGDGIKVRRMRADDFLEEVPHFLPIFYANEMPRISGADQPLKRRMLAMEFNLQPTGLEDPTIKQRFLASQEVMEYLFALLVQGCVAALREGLEDVKDEFGAYTVKSFDETTHLGEFFEWLSDSGQLKVLDEVEQSVYGVKSTYVTVKAMHERYMLWVSGHGNKQDKHDALNYKEFNAQLRSNYGWVSESTNSRLRWVGKALTEFVSVG
jgi:phage/plasmid-associated DNA primase